MKTEIELSELLKQITPLPWEAEAAKDERERDCMEVNSDAIGYDGAVADLCGRDACLPRARLNAAYLTHCANVLPELVEALKSGLQRAEYCASLGGPIGRPAGPEHDCVCKQIKSALSRAEKVSLP